MKFLKAVLFFFFMGLVSTSFSQSLNDYRTVTNATGNWTTVSNWQVYDGTNWVSATYYPGQVTGTNDVTIINGAKITLNTTIGSTQFINSITIGDGNGLIEELIVSGSRGINTTELNMLSDGLLRFASNGNDEINLPANTSITIDPSPAATLGVEHGLYNQNHKGQDCKDNSDKVIIGGVIYSSCAGTGSRPSFDAINNGGGNLSVSPTSNSPVCLGDIVNLSANPSGVEVNSAIYTWTAISPSNATYTLSSTIDTASDTPTETGTYLYEVKAESNGITDTKSVTVIVNPLPNAPVSSGNITECESSPIQTLDANNAITSSGTITWYDAMTGGNVVSNPTLNSIGSTTYYAEYSNGTCSSTRTAVTLTLNSVPTAPIGASDQKFCSSGNPTITNLTATGTNIQWYTSATGGTALTNTTPLTTNTYYASQSDTNCESSDRLAVNVIISGCRVITNRRITYRVKK